jgi:hypothetical protein
VLGALRRYHETAQVAVDAQRILLPHVERYPETYGGLTRFIVNPFCSDTVMLRE